MKIGITERGDAGRDLSWADKCRAGECDGVIVVTKSITRGCGNNILALHQNRFPVILHATCTGWGETEMEPMAYPPFAQFTSVANLLYRGLPEDRVVIRVDPILPTKEGFDRARSVFREASAFGFFNRPGKVRVRISVIDEYRHAKQRMLGRGIQPCYPEGKFFASPEQFQEVAKFLSEIHEEFGVKEFETCAEPLLSNYARKGLVKRVGCVSAVDIERMGLSMSGKESVNPQGRNGCLCLSCKTELLTSKHPCFNSCAYCYWRD